MRSFDYDFSVCVSLFLKYLERNNFSGETSRGYEKDLQFFKRFMRTKKGRESFSINDFEKDDLLKFMDYGRLKGHTTNTIARRISTLKSFYKFLVYELDYPVDVAARIRVPKTYIPLPYILTEAEVKLLLEKSMEISVAYELLFSVLYYTGSRLTPVRTLKTEHVHLDKRLIYFPKVKGGRDLYLPLHDHLFGLFQSYFKSGIAQNSQYVFQSNRIPNQPVSASDVRKKLRMAAEMAGIKSRVTPHIIRHCTATHLTIKKIEQRTIADILGHTDLRSTMRYQHLSVDHLRDPINSL